MAGSLGQQLRSPVLHWPSEQDLDYQDVTFPALDGVPLERGFIPAAGSDKLIIANHPMGFSRSGIPAHLEPWTSVWAPERQRRSRSTSSRTTRSCTTPGTTCWPTTCATSASARAANGGIASSGIFEARDVARLAGLRAKPARTHAT